MKFSTPRFSWSLMVKLEMQTYRKNTHCRKKFTRSILCSFGSFTMTFFFAIIPYFNFQINFQPSHLTKKETEDASKCLSSYCMEALNWEFSRTLHWM